MKQSLITSIIRTCLIQHCSGGKGPDKGTYTFFLLVLHATPNSFRLDNWSTWHRCQRWDSIVDWRSLITGENLTGRKWDLNPGPCRLHSHCSKRPKPLRHLALLLYDIAQFSTSISGRLCLYVIHGMYVTGKAL